MPPSEPLSSGANGPYSDADKQRWEDELRQHFSESDATHEGAGADETHGVGDDACPGPTVC